MKSTQNLPTKLKELRKQNHYSQEYVAEQLNISRQAISHWENGRAYPDIDNLVLLAELYGVSMDELLEDEGDCEHKEYVYDNSSESSSIMETLVLSIVLILTSRIYFVGIGAAICVLIWLIYKQRNNKILYFLCVFCIIMGIYEMYVFYTHFNTVFGNPYVIKK